MCELQTVNRQSAFSIEYTVANRKSLSPFHCLQAPNLWKSLLILMIEYNSDISLNYLPNKTKKKQQHLRLFPSCSRLLLLLISCDIFSRLALIVSENLVFGRHQKLNMGKSLKKQQLRPTVTKILSDKFKQIIFSLCVRNYKSQTKLLTRMRSW